VALIPGQQHVKSSLEKEADKVCNFTNVKRTHISYKRLFSSYILALNKLSYKKFARLTFMKLTEGLKFHQHFTSNFVIQKCFLSFSLIKAWLCNFLTQNNIVAKAACKMLVKLTTIDHNNQEFLFSNH